jgi:hypothetical protein
MYQPALADNRSEAFKYYRNIHISIYNPMALCCKGSFINRNKLRYCMSLKKVEKKILDKGFSFAKVRNLMKRMDDLVESSIWKRNCSGIAIFSKSEKIKIFSTDITLPQIEVVGDMFYTEPLIKMPAEVYGQILFSLSELDSGNIILN